MGGQADLGNDRNFNPRSREGSDVRMPGLQKETADFNPRSREGSD